VEADAGLLRRMNARRRARLGSTGVESTYSNEASRTINCP
jgi:hypothetical protein